MMDLTPILQAISTTGFPIVLCIIMCYYVKYKDDRDREITAQLSKAVENNTVVITRLIDSLEREELVHEENL